MSETATAPRSNTRLEAPDSILSGASSLGSELSCRWRYATRCVGMCTNRSCSVGCGEVNLSFVKLHALFMNIEAL
jgi:hypothetical protein